VRWDPALYLAELDTLLGVVETERQAATLLIGHNPGLEELAQSMIGTGDPAVFLFLAALIGGLLVARVLQARAPARKPA